MGTCNIDHSWIWRYISSNCLGKILSAVIALLGIGLVAVPTGIISAGFVEAISNTKQEKDMKYCPYCGEKLE